MVTRRERKLEPFLRIYKQPLRTDALRRADTSTRAAELRKGLHQYMCAVYFIFSLAIPILLGGLCNTTASMLEVNVLEHQE